MYKIGFIDDDKSFAKDYKIRFEKKGIELLFVENFVTKLDVIDWILNNGIKCMLIDYKLTGMYDFNGTELVAFINSELPDLPCIILSSYCDDGINENLVIKNLFIERSDLSKSMGSNTFEKVINSLKQAVDVFNKRLELHISEFENLQKKKYNGIITAKEEERLLQLFKLLRAYNEVDDLPAELLTTNISKQITNILESLNKLIDKEK